MKILLVTPMPPQRQAPGAIPLVLHAQLTGLLEKHDVALVTVAGLEPGEPEAVSQLQKEGVEVYAVRRSNPTGLARWQRRWRLGSTWLQGRIPWRSIWFWEPEVQRILDRLFTGQHFDLVLVEDNAMGIYQYQTNAPLLFTEHEVRRPRPVNWDLWRHSSPLRTMLAEADWHRWKRYQPAVWRKFDRIQVFTERDAHAVEQLAPDLTGRVHVNPFGVELPDPLDPAREQANQLLFVGNYTHLPNVDAALWLGQEIMPRLRERVPGVCLSLVGIYPPKEVQALAGNDIEVTGPVAEIEPYLERAALVLAPVRIGGGMRMKVLKAMASGKAVVTTQRGADGLEIGEARPPIGVANGVQEFVELTAALLNSPDRRREMGRQARLFVSEHFSPQAYTCRLEEVYAQMRAVPPGRNGDGRERA